MLFNLMLFCGLGCKAVFAYRKMLLISPGLKQLRKGFFGWQAKIIVINERCFS